MDTAIDVVQRYADLLAERTNDPLGLGLARAPDDDATAAMNEKNRPAPVPVAEVIAYLLSIDKWVDVQDSPLRSARNLVTRLTRDGFEEIDLTDTAVMVEVIGLIPDVLTSEEGTALVALGDNRRTRGEEIGVGKVRNRDWGRMRIEHAKGLI